MPNGRCRMHSGKALAGIASPAFKHGRYSRRLPERMLPRYDEARADREYLALSDDIALIDSRIEDVLTRVDTGECGENWRALAMAVKEFNEFERKAQGTTNEGKRDEYLRDRDERMRSICLLVEAGISDIAAWNELAGWLERRRRTVETEQKRLIAMQEMVTADQVALIHGRYIGIIKRNVTDPATLGAISRELDKIELGLRQEPA